MNQLTKTYSVLNENVIPSHDPLVTTMSSFLVIYEVIRIINGKCLFLELHLNRLQRSISLANKMLNISLNDITRNISKLLITNSLINGNIRINVCFQETDVHLLSQIIPHHYPSTDDYLYGVKAITVKAERTNPQAKIFNSDFREKINALIVKASAWEALLINDQNHVTEGSKSNLFAVKGNHVYTPPLKDVLAGITRLQVIKLCKDLSINLTEINISDNEINQFNSFFITGTSPMILALRMIDNTSFDVSNEVIKKLSLAYDNMVLQYINNSNIPIS
jgi:branched-chain amino acid aminotransferase